MKTLLRTVAILATSAVSLFGQGTWQTTFMDKPSYHTEPLPPEYLGMSLNELLSLGYQNVSLPSMTPSAYQWTGGVAPSNVSPELRGHPMLDQLVEDLAEDPIALAAFVQNEIELTNATQGTEHGAFLGASQLVRGALGTYMERQGSPWEQCALLVYLLRKAGYPAAYVQTTSTTSTQGMFMLERRLYAMLGLHIADGATYNSVLGVDFPWVVVYTDKSGTGGEWVHLFPWIKDTVIEEGLNPYDYLPAGYDSGKLWMEKYLQNDSGINALIADDGVDTPGLLFERYVEQEAMDNNLSIEDFGIRVYNRRNHYWRWEDFPKPYIIGQHGEPGYVETLSVKSNDLKDSGDQSKFATIDVTIQRKDNKQSVLSTATIRLCDLHNRRFYAFYKPGTNKVALELSAFDESSGLTTGSFTTTDVWARQYKETTDPGVTLEIKVDVNGVNSLFSDPDIDLFTRPFAEDSLSAISVNSGRVTKPMLNVHARKFIEMQSSVSPSQQDISGLTMYLAGMTYWYNQGREAERVLNLHKCHTVLNFGVCIAKIAPAPGSMTADWTTPAVDVPLRRYWLDNRSTHPNDSEELHDVIEDLTFIEGSSASAHEHQVLNSFFGRSNAISTIKLLRLANERYPAEGVGNYSQGFFSFSRASFASANTSSDPVLENLRDEAGSMWTSAVAEFSQTPPANYAAWESVYVTPSDIAMDAAPGETVTYDGMGLALFTGNGGFGFLIDGQLAGGAGPKLSDDFFEPTSFENLVIIEKPDGSFEVLDGTADESGSYFSGLTGPDGVISLLDGVDTSDFEIDPLATQSWESGGEFLGYNTGSMTAGEIGAAIYSDGYLGGTGYHDQGSGFTKVADPVDIITGEFYIDETDLTLPGPLSLQIRRNYSSKNLADNMMGYGWKFSLMHYINVTQSGDLIYAADPDGSVVAYRKVPSSSPERWEPEVADNPKLNNYNGGTIGGQINPFNAYVEKTTEGSDDIYQLYRPDGRVAKFRVRSFPITDGSTTITRERPYLEEWRDAFGNALTFSYYETSGEVEYGQLRRIESTNGNYLGFNFDYTGHVTEIFTNDGRRVRYHYDNYGDMVGVTLPDSSKIKYEYDHREDAANNNLPYSTHLITAVRKPDGRALINEYDSLYNPAHATYSDPKYRRVVKQYSTVGTDLTPLEIAEYEYNPASDPWVTAGFDVTYVHSDVRSTLGRVTTTYVHKDSLYHYIAEPLATGFSPTNTDIDYVVSYEWFFGGETNGYVNSLKTMKDKRGLKTHYQYDSNGSIKKVSVEGDITGDGVSETVDTHYFFDSNRNRLKKVIHPAHDSSKPHRVVYHSYPTIAGDADYAADGSNPGQYLYAYLPSSIAEYSVATPSYTDTKPSTSDLIVESTLAYGREIGSSTEAHGLLLKSTTQSALDVDDKTQTTWQYDSRGYPTSKTRKTYSSEPDVVTQYEYNAKGELMLETNPSGTQTHFDYDMLGRLESTRTYHSSHGNHALQWNLIYYTQNGEVAWEDGSRFNPEDYVFRDYDGAGRVIAEVRWRSQAKSAGTGVEAISGQGAFLGQAITYFEYDGFGNLVSTIDPRGNETRMVYDELGRMESVTHAYGSADAATEELTYEPGGLVHVATNALDGDTTTLYTTSGQPKQKTFPDNRELSWTYYLDGRIKTQTLSNDAVWTYTYDDENLTETRELTKGSDMLAKTVLGFDTRGNEVSRKEYTSDTEFYEFTKAFDGLGRVITEQGPPAEDHPVTSDPVTARQTTTYRYYFYTNGTSLVRTINGSIEKRDWFDPIQRPTEVSYWDGASLADQTTFEYSTDKHQVISRRTGPNSTQTLETKTYTDTFGNVVLTVFADGESVRNVYDKAGNLTDRYDELNLRTQFSYDSRNRLKTTIRPDTSTVTLGYDDANNITQRTMPGDLTWAANFDHASRIDWEQLQGTGANVSRRVDYSYYPSGDNEGLLQTRIENDGDSDQITHTFNYDGALRVNDITSSGANYPDINVHREFDLRSLATNVTRSSPNDPETVPSVRISRLFDGYRQLIDEKVESGSGVGSSFAAHLVQSHLIQGWDELGRRTSLYMGEDVPAKGSWNPRMDFSYIANGLLDEITPATATNTWKLDYLYEPNAQMNRSYFDVLNTDGSLKYHARETRTLANGSGSSMRDPRGRLIDREVYARPSGSNIRVLREDLGRDDDGKITSLQTRRTTGAGGSWATLNETRGYTYDPQNRRLDTETFQPNPDSSANPVIVETLKYTFDADDLGVRIKAENQTATEVFWEADPGNNGLDAFKRLKTEDRDSEFYSFIAEGSSVGPGKFTLWLGEGASPSDWSLIDTLYPDPDYGSGQWQAALSLTDGQYTLKAKADHVHPDSTFEPESTSTFTVNAGGEQRTLTNAYDQSGRLISRSWASGDVTQVFTWDATGKLVKVVQEDTRTTPLLQNFTWTALYDPAGRRIKTSYMPGNSPEVGASAARSIHSWYDPMVEFLEVAVEYQGKRWWKFHGPDMDSSYGTFQGVGGLEAVVNEETEAVYPIVDDAFGHIVGYIDLTTLSSNSDDTIVWKEKQMSGYGPLPGYQMKPMEESGDLLASLAWQSRRADPTGLFCMGARYYDPASGSFVSADPLGHDASLNLYSYSDGDPINFLDPDGRQIVSGNWMDSELSIFNPPSLLPPDFAETYEKQTSIYTGPVFSPFEMALKFPEKAGVSGFAYGIAESPVGATIEGSGHGFTNMVDQTANLLVPAIEVRPFEWTSNTTGLDSWGWSNLDAKSQAFIAGDANFVKGTVMTLFTIRSGPNGILARMSPEAATVNTMMNALQGMQGIIQMGQALLTDDPAELQSIEARKGGWGSFIDGMINMGQIANGQPGSAQVDVVADPTGIYYK